MHFTSMAALVVEWHPFMLWGVSIPLFNSIIILEHRLHLSMHKKIQRKTRPLLVTPKKRLTINNCQPLIINF